MLSEDNGFQTCISSSKLNGDGLSLQRLLIPVEAARGKPQLIPGYCAKPKKGTAFSLLHDLPAGEEHGLWDGLSYSPYAQESLGTTVVPITRAHKVRSLLRSSSMDPCKSLALHFHGFRKVIISALLS
ncbi:unnamed protein product [Lepidochelys kempii]